MGILSDSVSWSRINITLIVWFFRQCLELLTLLVNELFLESGIMGIWYWTILGTLYWSQYILLTWKVHVLYFRIYRISCILWVFSFAIDIVAWFARCLFSLLLTDRVYSLWMGTLNITNIISYSLSLWRYISFWSTLINVTYDHLSTRFSGNFILWLQWIDYSFRLPFVWIDVLCVKLIVRSSPWLVLHVCRLCSVYIICVYVFSSLYMPNIFVDIRLSSWYITYIEPILDETFTLGNVIRLHHLSEWILCKQFSILRHVSI
jgi:hypothetical protein